MKKYQRGSAQLIVLVLIIAALAGFFYYQHSSSKPTIDQVTTLIPNFLASECSGDFTMDRLSDVSVGEYQKQVSGWPIYASHQETCVKGSGTNSVSSETYNGLQDAEKSVALAWAHRQNGSWVLYTPQIFK